LDQEGNNSRSLSGGGEQKFLASWGEEVGKGHLFLIGTGGEKGLQDLIHSRLRRGGRLSVLLLREKEDETETPPPSVRKGEKVLFYLEGVYRLYTEGSPLGGKKKAFFRLEKKTRLFSDLGRGGGGNLFGGKGWVPAWGGGSSAPTTTVISACRGGGKR